MCEWRKIKNATSVLTNNASIWWDNLCEFDKPRFWNDMKTLMRETFVHVSSCEDKEDSLEEDNHVVPLVLHNLLQDIHPYKAEDEPDMLIASCENSETSSHDAPSFPTAKESNGNVLSATFTEGESSLDVLKFSTNHAMIE